MIKELYRFLLQFFFISAQIDPTFQCLCCQDVIRITIDQFLNDLARSFELLCVPQEGSRTNEISVGGLFLPLIQLKHKGIDSFLVDVSAPLMVVNQCNGRWKTHFAPFLDPWKLTDGLGHASFVEDAKGFPKCKTCVLAFVKLLQSVK